MRRVQVPLNGPPLEQLSSPKTKIVDMEEQDVWTTRHLASVHSRVMLTVQPHTGAEHNCNW